MAGEGPLSTSCASFDEGVDADLRQHDVDKRRRVNTQGDWY
jgi:hypothetical protein